MNKAKRQNILSIMSLAVIILIGTLFAFRAVSAAVHFNTTDENWSGYQNELYGSADDTYPYNSSSATIRKVSLDVLYGTTRDLTFYHGEFPYDMIYDSDDEYEDGWEGYYAEDGTSATGNNPNYGASSTVTAADYWGSDVSTTWFSNVPTAEQVNAGETKSLRLYANSKTITGFLKFLSTLLYVVVKFFAWLAVLIIGLIIRAKNISLNTIMTILNLDNLNEVMTKNFIYDGDHLKLSAFTGFCIVILIFTIAMFAVRWVKGSDKTQGLWEILGTVGIGLIIIGMCLTGRISSLGSSLSSMASKAMYAVAQALGTSGDGYAFEIDIDDSENETEVVQMCEMALVNKSFIDLQLCSQFNVSSVDELKFDKFGDPNGNVAKSYLSGVSSANMKNDFNNNLGYYYWFANSSAIQKTSYNRTMPTTDTQAVQNKLSSMMTYLQVQYNANRSNPEISERIVKTVQSFARPGGGARFLCLLLFAVVLIMMAIVLFKYALNVIIAKIELFISLIGMIVAGPLILTSNKKLVETGKAILGMLLVAFMEITVYSIIFDIIIYVVSAMFKPDIIVLLAVFALLLLLLYFNPVIAQKIKQIMERTERRISPSLVDSRRAAKNWAKNKAREGIQKYDQSEKVVGYKEDGTAITEKRGGNALSKLMHSGSNAVFAEGNEHEGLIGMHTKLNHERQKNKAGSAAKLRVEAEAAVERKRREIESEAEKDAQKINREAENIENETVLETDENGEKVYDETKLSEEERKLVAARHNHIDELEKIKDNADYKDLIKQKEEFDRLNAKLKEGEQIHKMSEEDAARYKKYKDDISVKIKQISDEKKQIEDAIKERAAKEAMDAYGYDYDSAKGDTISAKIKNATDDAALNNHREELENTLKTAIDTMSKEVNNTTIQGKIGRDSKQTVNKEAATAQAAAMLQLSQLQNGEKIMDSKEAKEEVADIVDKVSQHYDKDKHSDDARVREKLYKDVENASNRREHAAAVNAYNKEIDRQNAVHSEQKAEVDQQYNDAKEAAGRVISKATVQEQLQTAINNRTKMSTTSQDTSNVPNTKSTSSNINSRIDPNPPQSSQTATASQQPQARTQQTSHNMYSNPVPNVSKPRANQPNAVENLQVDDIPMHNQKIVNMSDVINANKPNNRNNMQQDIKLNIVQPQTVGKQQAKNQAPVRPTYNNSQQASHTQQVSQNQQSIKQTTQPNMQSVINRQENVSTNEAKQAEIRMAQQRMNQAVVEGTKSISHNSDATKNDYVNDEARMNAMRQDSRMIHDIYNNPIKDGKKQ